MQAQQDLHQSVGDQLMQGPELSIRFEDRAGVTRVDLAGPGLEGTSGLRNHGIGKRLAGDFPQGDEAIHGGGKADFKDAVVAGGAGRLVIEIEGSVVTMRAQQDQDIQPIERIDESDAPPATTASLKSAFPPPWIASSPCGK